MKQLTDQTIIKYNEIRYNQIESDREFGTSKKGFHISGRKEYLVEGNGFHYLSSMSIPRRIIRRKRTDSVRINTLISQAERSKQ